MGKKKMLIIGTVIAIGVIVAGLFVWDKTRRVELEGGMKTELMKQEGETGEKTSLIAEAQSLNEASDIAELYGITLVEFKGGIAVFETDKNAAELIRMGEENNYPAIEVNHMMSLD